MNQIGSMTFPKNMDTPNNTAAKVERDLGIGHGVISRWKGQLREDGDNAFPDKDHLRPRDEQLHHLNQVNERLYREHDIFKKAVVIFSKNLHSI